MKVFTPTEDTKIQNTTSNVGRFQSNQTEDTWLILYPSADMDIPANKTVYFKAGYDLKLATMGI